MTECARHAQHAYDPRPLLPADGDCAISVRSEIESDPADLEEGIRKRRLGIEGLLPMGRDGSIASAVLGGTLAVS